MDKKTLLAVVLAILVMFSYSHIVQRLYPPAPNEAASFPSEQRVSPSVKSQTLSNTPSSAAVSLSGLSKLDDSSLRKISTHAIDYVLSDVGACIKSITIKKYNGSGKGNEELIYDVDYSQNALFSIIKTGFVTKDDLANVRYKYSKIDSGIEYSFKTENGVEIKKIYKVLNNYGLNLELSLINRSNNVLDAKYSIIASSNMKISADTDKRFIEAIVSVDNKQKRIRPSSPKRIENVFFGNSDWVGLQNQYFSIIIKPYHLQNKPYHLEEFLEKSTVSSPSSMAPYKKTVSFDEKTVSFDEKDTLHPRLNMSSTVSKFPNSNIQIELQNDTVMIRPGEAILHKFLLYSGPNNLDFMTYHQSGIENSLNFGTFGSISKLILFTLKYFYKIFHNYGLAIIFLAITITILLYPFTLKSLRSMKQLQLLQPKIDKLRKEYKENPQKLNREMMELYKKNKVNPFGGCLPMVLQMPIFFALYQALSRAIELKDASFLWIKDLSKPDKAFLLPTSEIFGFSFPINILPIAMAIAMFFQQKISMAHSSANNTTDVIQQQQKMMSVMMPILFGIIFYNMPSGLVLYWFCNTLITFFQQIQVTRHFHVEGAVS